MNKVDCSIMYICTCRWPYPVEVHGAGDKRGSREIGKH